MPIVCHNCSLFAIYSNFQTHTLILEDQNIELDQVVDLVRQKEVRAPIWPEQIRVNWEQAQQQADDDLRSIHCSRAIEHEQISAMVERLRFEPVLPR